jgi:hypothetical protein
MRVKITSEEKERYLNFATEIIHGQNQFNRFNQSVETQIARTYIGKLAEYVFLHFLHSKGVLYYEGDMFQIFQGQENSDTYDFVTIDNESVDIKTASLPFHSRIMIPMSQFHLKKDYYVGIKLNFKTEQGKILDLKAIEDCTIFGYIERLELEMAPVKHFGEGYCKSIELVKLKPIEDLLKKFQI